MSATNHKTWEQTNFRRTWDSFTLLSLIFSTRNTIPHEPSPSFFFTRNWSFILSPTVIFAGPTGEPIFCNFVVVFKKALWKSQPQCLQEIIQSIELWRQSCEVGRSSYRDINTKCLLCSPWLFFFFFDSMAHLMFFFFWFNLWPCWIQVFLKRMALPGGFVFVFSWRIKLKRWVLGP